MTVPTPPAPPGLLVMQRSFVYTNLAENSNKSWTVEVYVVAHPSGVEYTLPKTGAAVYLPTGAAVYRSLYARIGRAPQEDPHVFTTRAQAEARAEAKIREKLRGDYREVGGPLLRATLDSTTGDELAAQLRLSDAVSADQVRQAQTLLDEIAPLAALGSNAPARLVGLFNEYFRLVPTVLPDAMSRATVAYKFMANLAGERQRLHLLAQALATLTQRASTGTAQRYGLSQIVAVLEELAAPSPVALAGARSATGYRSFIGALDDDDE